MAKVDDTFGEFVRKARESRGMTVRAFAKTVGCSAPFVSDVEHDRRHPTDLETWARTLNIDVAELCARDPRQTKRSELEDLKRRVARLERVVFRHEPFTLGRAHNR